MHDFFNIFLILWDVFRAFSVEFTGFRSSFRSTPQIRQVGADDERGGEQEELSFGGYKFRNESK